MNMKAFPSVTVTVTALLVCSSAVSAENIMTCFGSVALGRYQQLDARTSVEAQTVKVWAITQEGMNTSNPWLFEKEPIVRTFSATNLAESQGGEQASDAITYEGKAWCRKDAYDSTKKCYGMIVMPMGKGAVEYREVELRDDGGFCEAYITAKLEGLRVVEPLGERPQAPRRQRAPG